MADFARLEEYPYPIAAAVRAALNIPDPNRRFRAFIKAFMATLKTSASISLCDFLLRNPGQVRVPEVEKMIQRRQIERPSLGHWWQVLVDRRL